MKAHTASEERGEQKTTVYMLLKRLHQVQNLVIFRQVHCVAKHFLEVQEAADHVVRVVFYIENFGCSCCRPT
jgi:hypothetical protein